MRTRNATKKGARHVVKPAGSKIARAVARRSFGLVNRGINPDGRKK